MTDRTSASDDLAFMKSVVEGGGKAQMTGGSLYVAAGLLYGAQTLFHYGQLKGWVKVAPAVSLAVVVGVTGLFLVILTWVLWRNRTPAAAGPGMRGLNAAFAGAGLANLAMVIVFGVNAAKTESFLIWELYPVVVFALQGAAWWVAFTLRRHLWLGAVAIGWLLAAIGLGLVAGTEAYILGIAASLLGLMVIPGAVMMRLAKQGAA